MDTFKNRGRLLLTGNEHVERHGGESLINIEGMMEGTRSRGGSLSNVIYVTSSKTRQTIKKNGKIL